MEIRKIEQSDLARFLDFFDNRAMRDNPNWAFCYCNCFYADHCEKLWSKRTREENREATSRRIEAGEMHGYLAIANGQVVGWCGAGPMNSIPDFAEDEDSQKNEIGVITCFLVDPTRRGEGIARALLRGACSGFTAAGLSIAEGNPRPNAVTDAELHFGPLKLFESEGFSLHRTDPEDGSVYVRKSLIAEQATPDNSGQRSAPASVSEL